MGEGTSRVATSQPRLPFLPGSICISLETPLLFWRPLSLDRKWSQRTRSDSSFLLQRAAIPSLPSLLYMAGVSMLLESLSLSRIVRSASGPPKPLFHAGPHLAPHPLWPPQTGTLINSGSREPAAWRAPTWEPAGEATTPRSPGRPLPLHSTQLRAAQPPGRSNPLDPNFLGRRKAGGQQAER